MFRFSGCLLIVLAWLLGSCQSVSDSDRINLAKEYYNIGTAYAELKQYDKARQYLEKASDLRADFSAVDINLARVLIEQAQFDLALKLLSQAMLRQSDNTNIEEMYAYALTGKGEKSKARAAYEQLLPKVGERSSVLLNLARLYKDDNPKKAFDFFKRAVKVLTTVGPKVNLEGGDLAVAAKDPTAAFEFYLAYAENSDKDPVGLLRAATFMEKEKHFERAVAVLKELSLKEGDSQAAALFRLASVQYTGTKELTAAADSLRKALKAKYADWKAVDGLYQLIQVEVRPEFLSIIRESNKDFKPTTK